MYTCVLFLWSCEFYLQEWQVCEIAIGVLGDICRALEGDILQYCDPIMSILLTNLQSEEVQRTVKPLILASFSDIALAIGKDFNKYLGHVLAILQSAQVSHITIIKDATSLLLTPFHKKYKQAEWLQWDVDDSDADTNDSWLELSRWDTEYSTDVWRN